MWQQWGVKGLTVSLIWRTLAWQTFIVKRHTVGVFNRSQLGSVSRLAPVDDACRVAGRRITRERQSGSDDGSVDLRISYRRERIESWRPPHTARSLEHWWETDIIAIVLIHLVTGRSPSLVHKSGMIYRLKWRSAESLTTFRQRLKAHLFQNHFPAISWTLTNFPGH